MRNYDIIATKSAVIFNLIMMILQTVLNLNPLLVTDLLFDEAR